MNDASIIFHNALILDGSGSEPFTGALRVEDDRIADILPDTPGGGLQVSENTQAFDLNGAYLAPGFIDVHTHSDLNVLQCPDATSTVYQGVTTEVIGNCGFSPFPVTERNRADLFQGLTSVEWEIDWTGLDGYARAVEEQGTAVNLAPLLGHGQLRAAICGYRSGSPGIEAMTAMRREVDRAMQQGAWGISSGLEYAPGSFSNLDELAEIVGAVPQVDRLYTTHMRNEGEFLLDAIDESIAIAERTDSRLQISHLKISGRPFWGQMDEALDRIEAAAQRGLRVAFDRYPYVAGSTHMAIFLPPGLWEGGAQAFLQRLKEDRARWERYLRDQVYRRTDFSGVMVTDSGPADRSYQGKTLNEIAEDVNQEPEAAALDIILESQGRASIACFCMDEEETRRILAHPCCFLGSDGFIHSPHGPLGQRCPHPRSYGTAPRFLGHYVRDLQIVSLPEAIRKMTAAPAEHFGLKQRGRIREGYIADLVSFSVDEINDPSDFGDPHHPAEGFAQVMVGGRFVIQDGRPTGDRPGAVLSRNDL